MVRFMASPKEYNTISFDATDKPLGRLATAVAFHLQGKHLPSFRREKSSDIHVRITNASRIVLTGNKRAALVRYHSSGFPGGIKAVRMSDRIAVSPEQVIRDAVARMLPKNRLRPTLLKQLSITP